MLIRYSMQEDFWQECGRKFYYSLKADMDEDWYGQIPPHKKLIKERI